MRQVLFHIPLRADWLPASFPLYLFLLTVGLGLSTAAWLVSRRVGRPALQEGLRNVSFWAGGAGVIAALVVYFGADKLPQGLPIYGFGMMLFLAFIICTWLASRRAESEGVAKEHVQDLTIWLFIFGLIGARITFLMDQKPGISLGELLGQFYKIWDGGIILYGSVIGGLVGYVGAYLFIVRKHHLSTLKIADILAPSIAVGLCLGRFGCFLNGCCYGMVACSTCPVWPAVTFPLSAPAREGLVDAGYQTAAGFTLADNQPRDGARVGQVDPGSLAFANGLRPGDVIVTMNGKHIANSDELVQDLVYGWERGATKLAFTVKHPKKDQPGRLEDEPEELQVFAPRTLRLYPAQLYEIVSMFLMFLLLSAYYPFRRHDGQVMAVLMVGYGVHRYLNELLRDDPRPKGFESYTSVYLFVAGVALWVFLQTRPVQYRAEIKDAKK